MIMAHSMEVEVEVDEGVDLNVQAGLMDIGDWTSWSFWHMRVYMCLCVCLFGHIKVNGS